VEVRCRIWQTSTKHVELWRNLLWKAVVTAHPSDNFVRCHPVLPVFGRNTPQAKGHILIQNFYKFEGLIGAKKLTREFPDKSFHVRSLYQLLKKLRDSGLMTRRTRSGKRLQRGRITQLSTQQIVRELTSVGRQCTA